MQEQTPEHILYTQDGVTYYLDFLLVVELKNHTIIRQSPDDKSRERPDKSFFYDIQKMVDEGQVAKASLVGKGMVFSIDLIYGNAEINGQKIYPPVPPPPGSQFRLLYYRTVTQSINTAWMGGENKMLAPKVAYYIGWKIAGTNKKWELGVS